MDKMDKGDKGGKSGRDQMQTLQARVAELEEINHILNHACCEWQYWQDEEGRYRQVTQAVERITGYSPEEFLHSQGDLFNRILHPADTLRFAEHLIHRDLDHNAPIDLRIITKDHRVRWLSHLCTRAVDQQGNYRGRLFSNRDITDKKILEQERDESEDRLRSLVENSSDLIAIHNLYGEILYINPALQSLLGHKNQDLVLGKACRKEFIHPEDQPQHLAALERLQAKDGATVTLTTRFITRSGESRTIRMVKKRINDRIHCIGHDITDLTAGAIPLPAVSCPACITDLSGTILYQNRAAAKWTKATAAGKHSLPEIFTQLAPTAAEQLLAAMARAVTEGLIHATINTTSAELTLCIFAQKPDRADHNLTILFLPAR